MYSIIPIHWNIKSAPASPGRSPVGPALSVFTVASWFGTREKKGTLEARRVQDIESLVEAIDRVNYIVILLLHSWSTPPVTAGQL
jgi:hypothetical protein